MSRLVDGKDKAIGLLRCAWIAWNLKRERAASTDEKLYRHIASAKILTDGATSVSLAVGKHSGCGVPLNNAVMCMPNNVAILLPPQAR